MEEEIDNSRRREDAEVSDALVSSALDGDEQAFRQLYFEMIGTLQALVRMRWGTKFIPLEACSDLVQDCFLKAWENRGQLRDRTLRGFQAWVASIARHHVCDRAMHLKDEANLNTPINPGSSSGRQIPEKQLSTGVQGRIERVWKALNSMQSAAQREAVRLNKLEGWTASRIAKRMNISEYAVYGLLRRGKAELKKLLQDGADEHEHQ